MGYVKTVKATRAQFAQLLESGTVDPDTLYYVNDSNGWDSQSLDTGGDIYLGTKLLTAKPGNPMDNPGGVFFVAVDSQGNTESAWAASLEGLTGYYDGLKVVVYNGTSKSSATSLTLNLNSFGTRRVYRYGTTAISAIPAGGCTLLTYVGNASSGKWVMDNYVNSTYTVTNVPYAFGGIKAGTYGIKRYSLCAVTNDNKISSFTTSYGTGAKSPVDLDFKIGQPLFYRSSSSDVSAGTTFDTTSFYVSYNYFDMRYTGTNTLLTSSIGKGHDIYLEVSVDPQAGTYRPTENLLVTDEQLVQGKFYIHVGRQQSNDNNYWYRCTLLADNPLYYYDGTNLIPYDIWRANTLQDKLSTALRFVDSSFNSIGSATSVNQYEWSLALNSQNDSISQTIDFDLCLTLCAVATEFNADIWMELRYYDEHNENWSESTLVLASTSAMLGHNKTAATSVFLRAHAYRKNIATQDGTAYVFVCVQCDQQHECKIIGNTLIEGKPRASSLLIRHWIPCNA